jgi:hypothetical protein
MKTNHEHRQAKWEEALADARNELTGIVSELLIFEPNATDELDDAEMDRRDAAVLETMHRLVDEVCGGGWRRAHAESMASLGPILKTMLEE